MYWIDFKKCPPIDETKEYLFTKVITGIDGQDIHNEYYIGSISKAKYFRKSSFENGYTHYMELKRV